MRPETVIVGPRPLGTYFNPEELTKSEVLAIKSFGAAVASEEQQNIALDVIMHKLCGYTHITFSRDQKEQDVGEGRRLVGHMIQEILMTPSMENPDARANTSHPAQRRAPRHPAYGAPDPTQSKPGTGGDATD